MYGYETFHEKIMLDLINAVRTGQSRHAYIFEGDKGLGLYSSARLFAAALACTEKNAPCMHCHACTLSLADTNPDIITVRTEKKSIGADDIRTITADVYVKPFGNAKKVYIVEDAHLMTPQAQNAFLKTLEEPPEFAVFILIAHDIETLLPTVRSRCVTVRFPRISDGAVREYIKKKYPDRENIDFAVKLAEGVPYAADEILANEEFDTLRRESLDALARLLSPRKLDIYEAVKFAEEHKECIELWISFLRDIILISRGCDELVVNTDFRARLERAAFSADEIRLVRLEENLITSLKMLQRYINPRAALLWAVL